MFAGTGYYASEKVEVKDENDKVIGKEQYLFIKVDNTNTNTNTAVSYTVNVIDQGDMHSITQTYSMKIDNDAPTIDKVYKGEADVAANKLDESDENKIFDSNYVYTLGGKITEEASGFERLVFYYVRDDGVIDGQTYTNKNILDPLITTGTNDSKAAISDLVKRTFSQEIDDSTTNNYTLYSKKVSGKLGADGYTFTPTTASNITSDKHIRVGGLIEANGVLRRIMSIGTDGKVTFDTNTSVTAETSADVYFPYAQVVDNLSTEVVESSSANPFTFKSASPDDGDGMPESVGGSKSTGYNWTSNIHSTNIPDGPCALVVLAFDKAGNVSGKTYKVAVENSAPRLAKVWLGTDLNSSNSWQSGEFVGYDLYNANETYGIANTEVKATQTIQTAKYGSAFKIKDKLAVIAEIIGGNGDIMMVYGKGAANESAVAKAITNAGAANEKSNVAAANTTITSLIAAGDKIGTVTYNQAQVSTSLKAFTLTSQQVAGLANNGTITETTADGTGKSASFTFWDSTDELVQGSTSQNCVLRVTDFTIDLNDGVTPKAVINPFYWKDETENSLFDNSKANGHIDLEADWKTAPGYVSSATTGQYDGDPKVSGKITFTGTAYDDHVLKTLSFTLKNSAATPVTYLSGTMATYNPATGWDKTSGNSGSAIADGGSYEWTISDVETETTRHYGDTAYIAQGGHKIYWTLSIDSSLISDVAAADVTLTVTVTDKNNNSSASSTASAPTVTADSYVVTDGTTHVPSYRMDIVPYITGLTRPNAKTSTHRSRKGKYQVVLGETVTINGFNLPGKVDDKIILQTTANKGGTAAGTIKETLDATAGTKDSMSFKVPDTSGYIRVITNNITSLNNVNSGNEIESDYDGDEWTDDIYLSVWKNNEYFYFSGDPISPSMDKVKNGTAGQYILYGGWGTNGSRVYGSYPKSTDDTYNTGNAPSPDNGGGTSKDCQSVNNSGYGDPISYYDVVTDANGNRYNVIVDCWQGSGAGWGGNFVINRNGYSRHNGFNSTYTFGSTEMRHVIERMGSGKTPDNAESADGFDEIFNQFLNPRITEYNGSAYITYYDRYAKCLKWAMSKPADSQNVPVTKYATEGVITSSTYSTNHYKTGGMVVAGYDTLQTGGSYTNLNVGLWSDIAIDTTSGKPVIAYYDSTNRRLMIATSASATYPVNTNSPILANNTTTAAPTGGEGDAWNRQTVTDSASLRLGEYVSLALDGDNNIHIACKGAKNGALYYVYGERSDYGSYTWTTVCVDDNGSPGNWTDIKLTNPSSSDAAAGPVISYYDATNDASEDAIKVAYLESTTSNTAENWDTMTVPCNSAANSNRITLVLNVNDGDTASNAAATNNSTLAIGYVSSRFDCVYLRKE